MKKRINKLFCGKNNFLNGLFALMIISLIVLGCTCNEKDGFNFGTNSETSESNEDKPDVADKKDEKAEFPFKADEDEVPTSSQSKALVEDTLLRFNEAVKSGDFTEFHSSVAKVWKRQSSPKEFEKGFAEFIEKQVDISRVKGEDPDFSPSPKIDEKNGRKVLFLKGKYDTSPLPVNFNLEYLVDDDEWKLVFIGVDTRDK